MRLLAVLLLCAQVFSSKGGPLPIQDASCNDPNIFQAVDKALRKYNAGRKEGYQFALNRITEAGISSVGVGDDQYYVTYEIRESTCAAQDGHEWQDCQFRPIVDAATGTCKAHIYIKKEKNISNVISQNCNITSAEGPVQSVRYVCLGCAHPIPHNSEELQPIVKHGVHKFNTEEYQEYLFKFGEVKKATRQVVSGWNYDIHYTIIETNCSRDSFAEVNEECHPLHFVGTCHAEVYVIVNGSIAVFNQQCTIAESSARACLGCPELIPTNSTSLMEPLRHAINKFNSENDIQFLYKVVHVDRATQQVVAGMKFEVTFHIRPTNCSKAENEHLHDGCHFLEDSDGGEERKCKASIVVVPWEKKVDIKSLDCSVRPQTPLRYAYIPGLGPFRGVYQREHQVGLRKTHAHKHGNGNVQKHGHDCKGQKGRKHKHDKKKCKLGNHQDSSVEPHEQPTQNLMSMAIPGKKDLPKTTSEKLLLEKRSLIEPSSVEAIPTEGDAVVSNLPVEPDITDLFLNLNEDFLPKVPEPPAIVCPGEPWKPKLQSLPSPSPTPEKTELDLWQALFDEPTNAPEKSEDILSTGSGDFTDDDLLAALA